MAVEQHKKSRLLKLLRSLWIWKDQRLDKKLGVDFSIWETNAKTGVEPLQGNQYQPSTNGLRKVLKKLPITEKDAIIDIGCGKGKAMYMLRQFPFFRVDGLELSGYLCGIATENLKTLKLEDSTVVNEDAACFQNYDAYNYFYMFNSFPQATFQAMLDQILLSQKRNPRKMTFIYLNPVCHNLLLAQGFKLLFCKKSAIKWFEYRCYTYDP